MTNKFQHAFYVCLNQGEAYAPEETVIIEDSPSGIQEGKAAEAYVIGYKGAEVQQDTTGADTLWKDYALFEEKWKKIQ